MNAISIIEYNISQNVDDHLLHGNDIADMIEDIIQCVNDDDKNDTHIFISKYKRLINDLRKV